MKQFLIRYTRTNGSEQDWHKDIAAFIAALDTDSELKGRISYRCLRTKDGMDYYHVATPLDDQAAGLLQQKEFFKKYQEKTKLVAGGNVEVSPLEVIAETIARA